MNELSVSDLNRQIKSILESHFSLLFVSGEISNLVSHTSGHIYFSLKDEESSVRCVLFKGNASKLKFRLENGQKVILGCGLSVYAPRGEYQLMVSSVTPSGKGSLAVALEQLKKKLSEKGYFDAGIKKPLPKFPKKVALITSATGAALQDMRRVAEKRWSLTEFKLFNTLVQGESAAAQIASNILLADKLGFDAIVLARGGGSIEDLWAFNEEIVADAIYAATTPIITGIGHEIDFTVADFVADVRAPTPSAAIETLLPDKNEIMMMLDSINEGYKNILLQTIAKKELAAKHIKELFASSSPTAKLNFAANDIAMCVKNFENTMGMVLSAKKAEVVALQNNFEAKDPSKTLEKSLAMVVKDGKKSSLKSLKKGDEFELQSKDTIIKALVSLKQNI
jgi:exodeoxyribonuclease VII large subunit